ncbi:MAG TPA: hypothetical protein VFG85_10435 [Gaiellaceae bacterium]|jgi:hypothetical protein|nr:hypothetical protein [Gaiellaceae bacterium]
MASIRKLSEQMIDMAERLDNVADAAKGKGTRRRTLTSRWLLLPAAGAGLYALATSGSFTRQAKDVVDQAKSRASDLPDDLRSRIHEASQRSTAGNGSQGGRKSSSARRTSKARKTTSSAR